MSASEVFLVWWTGGASCAFLTMMAQGAFRRFSWVGIVISALLWPATPFASAYVKKLHEKS